MPSSPAARAWDKKHTVFIGLKLNKNTDKDILDALSKSESVQGEIKRLIRIALSANN